MLVAWHTPRSARWRSLQAGLPTVAAAAASCSIARARALYVGGLTTPRSARWRSLHAGLPTIAAAAASCSIARARALYVGGLAYPTFRSLALAARGATHYSGCRRQLLYRPCPGSICWWLD